MKKIWLVIVGIIIGASALFTLSASIYGLIDDSFYYSVWGLDDDEYLDRVYEGFKRKNPDINYSDFENDMRNNNRLRKNAYDVLKKKNPDMPSFESFSRLLGAKESEYKKNSAFDLSVLEADDEQDYNDLIPFNYREVKYIKINWNHVFVYLGIFLLSILMLYFLVKTRFGFKIYLENKTYHELKKIKKEIKKVEHEIKAAKLRSENNVLTKQLDKIC